ncbi:MAG: hypothetical protein II825_10990 [Paludibacteraceae bacterium]|nr:hypothetical protein [Paludibacteraceae bacterium]
MLNLNNRKLLAESPKALRFCSNSFLIGSFSEYNPVMVLFLSVDDYGTITTYPYITISGPHCGESLIVWS